MRVKKVIASIIMLMLMIACQSPKVELIDKTPDQLTAEIEQMKGDGWKISTCYTMYHYNGDLFNPNYKAIDMNDPFKAQYKSDHAWYNAQRFMGPLWINGSNQVNWSDRGPYDNNQDNQPLAYEWCFRIMNTLGRQGWICLPHKANWDYQVKLAQLAYDWNLSKPLIIEYSNETWNGAYSQYDWCNAQGVAKGWDPGNKPWEAGQRYTIFRAGELWKAFADKFGATSSKIRRVACTQHFSVGGWWMGQIIDYIKSSTYNPNGLKPHILATGAYFGNGLDGASSTIWSDLTTAINTSKTRAQENRTKVDNRGWTDSTVYAFYECGQHVVKNSTVMCRNSNIIQKYKDFFNAVKGICQDVMPHNIHCETASTNTHWGATEYYGATGDKQYKWQAIKEWKSSEDGTNPPPSGIPFNQTKGIYALANSKYVSCNMNHTQRYCMANWATSIGSWEQFTFVDAGSSQVAFKANVNGYYVSADQNDAQKLKAKWATTIGTWEKYTWQWIDQANRKFTLKSIVNGKYMSANLNDQGILYCNWATTIGGWEQFRFD